MKFTVGIRTSSPGLISSIFIAPYVAAVAQLNDREYLEFNLSPNCFSNLSVSFAAPTHLDSNTFFTAFYNSSSIVNLSRDQSADAPNLLN